MKVLATQLSPTLCDTMDCNPPGTSVHGVLQVRILMWVVISFSRGSSQHRDWTCVSFIAGRLFTDWATREAQHELCPFPLTRLLACLQLPQWCLCPYISTPQGFIPTCHTWLFLQDAVKRERGNLPDPLDSVIHGILHKWVKVQRQIFPERKISPFLRSL